MNRQANALAGPSCKLNFSALIGVKIKLTVAGNLRLKSTIANTRFPAATAACINEQWLVPARFFQFTRFLDICLSNSHHETIHG